jgi:methylated-DNA-[protein]-cysteine S-methyltransferase
MDCYTRHYESPLGSMTMAGEGNALTGLWFDKQKHYPVVLPPECPERRLPVFEETVRWLDLYFRGEIPKFTPVLNLKGTGFRKAVWKILLTIPYGQTMTYREIAERIAEETGCGRMSAQAVGGAVGHNPISLIIPCHRVIGSDGSLTGYAGGMDKKARLLQLEQAAIKRRYKNE